MGFLCTLDRNMIDLKIFKYNIISWNHQKIVADSLDEEKKQVAKFEMKTVLGQIEDIFRTDLGQY